ncbi:MAG: hypothetical protein Q9176_005542 [Flavoplaca citrina]
MAAQIVADFTNIDPFSSSNVNKASFNAEGLKCELKTLESRPNWKGEIVVLEVGSKKHLDTPSSKVQESALVLVRYYGRNRETLYTELKIYSPYLKKAFKDIIPDFKGYNIENQPIVLYDGLHYFFHYRQEFQEYGRNLEDQAAIEHLMFALTYMYSELEPELYSYYNYVEAPVTVPSIDFPNLWMVFKPGDHVYGNIAGSERVLRVISVRRADNDSSRWSIEGQAIRFDGRDLGYSTEKITINKYGGYVPLANLSYKPLSYLPDKKSISERMIERGRKFIRLRERQHYEYEGAVEALDGAERQQTDTDDGYVSHLYKTIVKSRIVIDAERFYQAAPSRQLGNFRKTIPKRNEEHLRLKDEDYLICCHTALGFSLADRKWCIFEVDLVKDVDYNVTAFENLMLDEKYKQMISALIKVHTEVQLSFDDVIKGKGKGLIFLLHGIPGVGKSLTAGMKRAEERIFITVFSTDDDIESVADSCKRPLYTITAGDLGTSAADVELGMGKALRLAERWNAIVLIDEADVFLEQLLLRLLEYYQGIMFLATNRIESFDQAFQSRVHLAVKYPALSSTFRKNLWRIFLHKASPGFSLEWLDPESLERLANEDLNGRQIKNIARTAYALAVSEHTALNFTHVEIALSAVQAFKSDCNEVVMKD